MSGNFQISQNNLDNDTHLKILDTYLVCMLEVYLQESDFVENQTQESSQDFEIRTLDRNFQQR